MTAKTGSLGIHSWLCVEVIPFQTKWNIATFVIGIIPNAIGAILPDIQGNEKSFIICFSRYSNRSRKKWQKKLKTISMKRIAELVLFKCDKHLIRMQSPPPSPSPSSIPLLANFIVWKKKFFCSIFLWMRANIFISYICLSYRKFNRNEYKYKQKMRPLHSAHS